MAAVEPRPFPAAELRLARGLAAVHLPYRGLARHHPVVGPVGLLPFRALVGLRPCLGLVGRLRVGGLNILVLLFNNQRIKIYKES